MKELNRIYLQILQRLGIICLMQKDKLGTGLFLPSMLQDSILTHFSKLLSLVNANWNSLNLFRFLPDDTDQLMFLEWCNENRIEYLQK